MRKNPRISVDNAYATFVSGMLDLVDNLVDGHVVEPADTVRHDEHDTYLVVAADKGAASPSDLSNSIALRRGLAGRRVRLGRLVGL
ncbi:NAD-glutamate dehydrogenase domain-containing protein [Gordonia paraffinivorans]|uniref:NAD-glutamate dehydrogenase domain-containing protein n=1 Tax=Gordonia paraffinivorans TaxID=175628 RepID=UPI0027DF13C8|nr:NAD-glutamate dehydrogenase domain-containing protein [Gordonia paraffinivorans]